MSRLEQDPQKKRPWGRLYIISLLLLVIPYIKELPRLRTLQLFEDEKGSVYFFLFCRWVSAGEGVAGAKKNFDHFFLFFMPNHIQTKANII